MTNQITTNRKLRRNVVFVGACYMQYQTFMIDFLMKHREIDEMTALNIYIQSGLAALFEEHHRPHGFNGEIVVSELGQKIN